MGLTPAQAAALKADMLGAANPAIATLISGGDWHAVAAYYNASADTVYVWMPNAPRAAVYGAVVWKNLTVSDAPPTGATSVTDGSAANYANRCHQCLGFQKSLSSMLAPTPDGTLPGDQSGFRQGLQDALLAVPSGAGGTPQDAGWVAVRNAMRRYGTRFEVLFSVVDGAANKSSVYGQQVTAVSCYNAYSDIVE